MAIAFAQVVVGICFLPASPPPHPWPRHIPARRACHCHSPRYDVCLSKLPMAGHSAQNDAAKDRPSQRGFFVISRVVLWFFKEGVPPHQGWIREQDRENGSLAHMPTDRPVVSECSCLHRSTPVDDLVPPALSSPCPLLGHCDP